MKFGDYSPPALPSLDQQRDALQKGLGRALQWALNGHLEDDPLLEACLRDQRFDMQVEESRGDWLWRMVQAVDATARFRVPILHALHALSDDRSANQLCEFARHYTEAGDEPFRTRLYEIVQQKPFADSPWLGEKEIVQLEGERGFLFAAGVRGTSLAGREWEWDDGNLIDLAIERFREGHVRSLLEAPSNEAVSRFRESWEANRQRDAERKPPDSGRDSMTAIPVDDIIRAAEGKDNCAWFRGWGRYAAEADLPTVVQRLRDEHEPRVIAKLLRVFSARALPQFDPRLIELCQHGDDDVRRRAFSSLAPNTDPRIRQFALAELQKGLKDGSVAALFINNYQQGDEQRILEAMEFPDDPCQLHWLLMDVIKVLEKNSGADCSRLGVIAYASTPCENCRFYAARLLHQWQVAPTWLKEECRYDSGKECREMVETATTKAG